MKESADRNVTQSALMTAALLAHQAAQNDSSEHQALTLHKKKPKKIQTRCKSSIFLTEMLTKIALQSST